MTVLEDLLEPTSLVDPYPYYRRLREQDPVWWNPRWKGWVVTSYAEVRSILRNPEVFSSEKIENLGRSEKGEVARRRLDEYPALRIIETWVSFMDEPEHARLRRLLSGAFSVRSARAMKPAIVATAERLIGALPRHEQVNFLAAFTFLYPAEVIAELLGLPAGDSALFKEWSDDLMLVILGAGGTADRHSRAARGIQSMADYLRQHIDGRRGRSTGTDFISALVAMQESGEQISDDELTGTAMIMLFGGHETSSNLLANALVALDRNPDQRVWLQNHPDAMPGAVEEFLRFDGPTKGVIRWVKSDIVVGDHVLSSGDRVLVLTAAANHDPAQFEHPDELLLTRSPNDHVAFGWGAHVCLGAALARIETTVALQRLLERFSTIDIDYDSLRWQPTMLSRSLDRMQVTLT